MVRKIRLYNEKKNIRLSTQTIIKYPFRSRAYIHTAHIHTQRVSVVVVRVNNNFVCALSNFSFRNLLAHLHHAHNHNHNHVFSIIISGVYVLLYT